MKSMRGWKLTVTPNMDKFFGDRKRFLRDAINDTLLFAEKIIKEKYKAYTNKSTGKRIKSKHISEMLQTSRRRVSQRMDPYAPDKYSLLVWLASSTHWKKIAMKQEVGGAIHAKRSQLLTIPNIRAGVSPNARAGHFRRNATWVKLGGKPFLIKKKRAGKWPPARKARQPMKAKRRNRPRKLGRPGFDRKDILFFGTKSVYLKPKRFFADSMQAAERIIERKFPVSLRKKFE
jgi:hypothetical protein